MRPLLLLLTLACFAGCLVVPFLFFHGVIDTAGLRNLLVAFSIAYFVFATMAATRKRV